MQVHYDLRRLPDFENAVLSVGSFDGVHIGHRKLIRQVIKLARHVRGESVLITFDPHPRNIVDPTADNIPLLNSLQEKIRLLEATGIHHLVIIPFSLEFAQQSADEYIENFLYKQFRPKYIVLGYNHRFGNNRMGDIRYLRWKGPGYGYEAVQVGRAMYDDTPVSSTRIRQALSEKDITLATKMLGALYPLTGEVIKGSQMGREMGFPTANIRLENKDKLVPGEGVYAAYAIWQGDRYEAMLYIGRKPTLDQQKTPVIEVNLLNFNEQIYGQQLTIEVVQFIRGDQVFEDKQALQTQIHLDRKRIILALEDYQESLIADKENKNPSTAVAILNYNGMEHLKKYLKDILKSCREARAECHIIDNGSTDGSKAWISSNFPNLNIIELSKNWGFAGGYNHGLLHIDADIYFILNSDVALHENAIEILRQRLLSDPEIAVCQPKILDDKDKSKFEYAGAAGGWIDLLGYPFCRGRVFDTAEADLGQYTDATEIFWASGAAFMIHSELFHRFGGFDPQYFAHLEEIDLCWRLKRAGHKIYVDPAAKVFHYGGGTLPYHSPKKVYLNFRNSLITLVKNEQAIDLIWKIPVRLLLDYAAIILFIFQRKFTLVFSVLRAQLDFLLTIPLTIVKRNYHNQEILKYRIRNRTNLKGLYSGSIVWDFYLNSRKTFQKIVR